MISCPRGRVIHPNYHKTVYRKTENELGGAYNGKESRRIY